MIEAVEGTFEHARIVNTRWGRFWPSLNYAKTLTVSAFASRRGLPWGRTATKPRLCSASDLVQMPQILLTIR